jgi:Tfp pilus assembly PilM family ATPase
VSSAGLDFGAARAVFVRVSRRGTDVALEQAALVPAALGEEGELARAVALRAALDAQGGPRGPLALGVAGRDAIVRYLHLPLAPAWRVRLLMEFEVRDVEEKAGEPLSSDYRLLTIPEAIAGPDAANEVPVLVALAKEGPLSARIAALRAAGVVAARVMPTPVALFDAYVGLGYVAEERTVVLIDVGRDGLELAIVRDGFLVFARSIPHPPGQGATIGEREAQQLAGGIAASIQLARTQQKLRALPVDEVLLSGAHARSEPLRAALKQALRVEPGTFDPLERLSQDRLAPHVREQIAANGPELALALGLALAAAHPRSVDLDVAPRAEKARREFATRAVFLYAGAALLAVALLFSGVVALAARSSALSRRKELRTTLAGLEERRQALAERRAANRRTIATIDAISKRTQPGAAFIRLLERLRTATPPRVTVAEVALEDAPPPAAPARAPAAHAPAAPQRESAAPLEVAFRVRGEVDDASGEAAALLAALEAGIREDPAVISAKVTGTPVALSGAVLEFALSVKMRGAAAGEP